jgi:hypothetical protein
LVIDPTGGYGPDETACPGYSSAILGPDQASDSAVMLLVGAAIANGKCEVRFGIGTLAH